MTSTANGKILPKRISVTGDELRAVDPMSRRFLLALAVIGDVQIKDDPDQSDRSGGKDSRNNQRGGEP